MPPSRATAYLVHLADLGLNAPAAVDEEVQRLVGQVVGWGQIGRALGVSRQAARQRYGESTRTEPMDLKPAVIPSYTRFMKTAISVPDDIFADATKRAKDLGISRSEFVSTALRRYLDDLSLESLTQQINQVLDLPDYDEEASVVAVEAGRRRLSEGDW